MKFYNSIYASVYRCYDRYEKSPRYKAASFVFICMLGFFSLLGVGIKRGFNLDFSFLQQSSGFKLLFLLIGFLFLGLVWRYYSKDKVENIIQNFEEKTISERKVWGFIAVISFVLPWIVTAFLLSK